MYARIISVAFINSWSRYTIKWQRSDEGKLLLAGSREVTKARKRSGVRRSELMYRKLITIMENQLLKVLKLNIL